MILVPGAYVSGLLRADDFGGQLRYSRRRGHRPTPVVHAVIWPGGTVSGDDGWREVGGRLIAVTAAGLMTKAYHLRHHADLKADLLARQELKQRQAGCDLATDHGIAPHTK